jgi:hypothetical protein
MTLNCLFHSSRLELKENMMKYPGGEVEQLKREMEEVEPWVGHKGPVLRPRCIGPD